MNNTADITGEVFNCITVIGKYRYVQPSGRRTVKWKCECKCGNILIRSKLDAVEGKPCHKCGTKSCRIEGYSPEFNKVYSSYRGGAKRREYEFNLSRSEFADLIFSDCMYCGLPPGNTHCGQGIRKGSHDIVYQGIDRVNNDIGYIKSNSVPCCSKCNIMKKAMGMDDFLHHVKRIASHLNL